ncbi:MAG: hypothetical protein WCO89_07805 [Syntrophus sp. (in: bacteria)]
MLSIISKSGIGAAIVPLSLLVVEDSSIDRSMMHELLTARGYVPLAAHVIRAMGGSVELGKPPPPWRYV